MTLDGSTQPALFASEHQMITVYGQPGCQPCRLAMRQLDKEEVPYNYVDLTEHPEKLQQFKEAGVQSTPIIETPTERFTGLQPERIRDAATEVKATITAQQYPQPQIHNPGVEQS